MVQAVGKHETLVWATLAWEYNALPQACQTGQYKDNPLPRLIAMLTDFGTHDPYTGIMKAVVLGICPDALFVDLTHAVQRHAIRQGAFLLAESVRYFPAGTVFLAVVDPGVGGVRRPIAADAGGYRFVGPDNGLLSDAIRECGGGSVVELVNARYRRNSVSATFHGRDVFGPAAANLANGMPLDAFGPVVTDMVSLIAADWTPEGAVVRGEIVHIDTYGNLITSIGPLTWQGADSLSLSSKYSTSIQLLVRAVSARVTVLSRGKPTIGGVSRTYGDVARGTLLALVGSYARLEVACNQGNAAQLTGAVIGDPVELTLE